MTSAVQISKQLEPIFFSSQRSLMFSEDRESILEKELKFKISGYKKMEDALNAASMDNSTVLPLQIIHYMGQSDTEVKIRLAYTGHPFPIDPFSKLAASLVQMHKTIMLHGQDFIEGQHKEYRCRKEEIGGPSST